MRLISAFPVPLAVSVAQFNQAMPWIEVDNPLTIEGYLYAAQEVIETASRRPLTERTVEIEFDLSEVHGFRCWWFPVAPVSTVTAVRAVQPLEADVTIALDQIALQQSYDEPQLWFSDVALSSADPCKAMSVRVTATVGYATGQCPMPLKQAIILLVKEWYDAGVSIGDLAEPSISFNVKALIKQQRYQRPWEFS